MKEKTLNDIASNICEQLDSTGYEYALLIRDNITGTIGIHSADGCSALADLLFQSASEGDRVPQCLVEQIMFRVIDMLSKELESRHRRRPVSKKKKTTLFN